MSKIAMQIINGVAAQLNAVEPGNEVVDCYGRKYAFKTKVGQNCVIGRQVVHVVAETDKYPACSICITRAASRARPDDRCNFDETLDFSIEAADLVPDGSDELTTAFALLEDIKHAIDTRPTSVHANETMLPGSSTGRPAWELTLPTPGSKIVMVARYYRVTYCETYPYSDICENDNVLSRWKTKPKKLTSERFCPSC